MISHLRHRVRHRENALYGHPNSYELLCKEPTAVSYDTIELRLGLAGLADPLTAMERQ